MPEFGVGKSELNGIDSVGWWPTIPMTPVTCNASANGNSIPAPGAQIPIKLPGSNLTNRRKGVCCCKDTYWPTTNPGSAVGFLCHRDRFHNKEDKNGKNCLGQTCVLHSAKQLLRFFSCVFTQDWFWANHFLLWAHYHPPKTVLLMLVLSCFL